MFRISDFSRFTRVSVKMLRHYDEIGLLRPARVDPESGYRLYSADQLPRLNRIIALKDLGFSLEQVAELLDEGLGPGEIRGMLLLRRAEIAGRLREEQRRLREVEARLRLLDAEGGPPPDEVVLRPVPELLVASLRRRVDGAAISGLFDQVEAHAAAARARAFGSPLSILHDAEHPEGPLDIEVAVPLARPIPPAGDVVVRSLPAVAAMACVVFTGGYDRSAEVLGRLLVWAEASRHRVAGPLREVYLRFGADHAEALGLPQAFLADQPGLFVTELQLPVEPD